jgi:trans-aconitate methyltransferase
VATPTGNHPWTAYQAPPVQPLCRQVLTLCDPGDGRVAIDLGCGAGRETRALLVAGWRVHAVDNDPDTRDRVLDTTRGTDRSRLTIHTVDFADMGVLPPADLVYAGHSLPHVSPAVFGRTWQAVRSCLRPGAWLAVNLFGDRDGWAGTADTTFLSEAAVRVLFTGLEIVAFREVDADGPAAAGPKHWHRFDVIAHDSSGLHQDHAVVGETQQ